MSPACRSIPRSRSCTIASALASRPGSFPAHRSVAGDTWRIYRLLRETFGEPRFIEVPASAEEVASYLAKGQLLTLHAWTETIRLWFASGIEAVEWMFRSGYATHADLEQVGPEAVRFLEVLFAEGMEGFREGGGIPLDLVVSGVVSQKPND